MKKKKKEPRIKKLNSFLFIFVIFITMIILRLVYLQVFKHEEYVDKANVSERKFIEQKAPRGNIYDSQGNMLAKSEQVYNITFTTNTKSKVNFYEVMDKLFKIIDDNGEKQEDNFNIIYDENNGFYFDFGTKNEEVIKAKELRFKKDRGVWDFIKNKLYPKLDEDISTEQQKKIDEEALKVSPEDVFNYLIYKYSIDDLLGMSKEEQKSISSKLTKSNIDETFKIYKSIAEEVKKKYDIPTIRRYMIVKDQLKMQSYTSYNPIYISENIKKETAFIIYQKMDDMQGVDISLEPIRTYPNKSLASSVLGYISSINPDNKERYEEQGYDVNTDKIGVTGIEGAFERYLKGTKGGKNVKINKQGRPIEELSAIEPSPGDNVHLTIDAEIQYVAENALKERLLELQRQPESRNASRGVIIVQEVDTGRILALANYPSYDPNIFSIVGYASKDDIQNYFAPDYEKFAQEYISRSNINKTVDQLFPKMSDGSRQDKYDIYPKPFYNYATMGLLPPGSTFKPFTALCGLQSNVIEPNTIIKDEGVFDKYPEISGADKSYAPECEIYSMYGKTHGLINVSDALKVSCNYFFYETAYRLWKQAGGGIKGLNCFEEYADKVGLGYIKGKENHPSTGIEIAENFGSAYNFDRFKDTVCLYAKFDLVSALEGGAYGQYHFVPFDIGNKETDNEELRKAKTNVKDIAINRLRDIGTDKKILGYDDFVNGLIKPLKEVASLSDEYKKNISNSGSSLDKQIRIVAEVIGQMIIFDKGKSETAPAELINASIGQGANQFTPLQLVGYISTIVNGGTRYKAHLVDKITDSDGNVVDEFKPEVISKMDISEENLNAIKKGMWKVNEDEVGGTAAQWWHGFPIETGGKTGTASFTSDPRVQASVGRSAYGVYISFAPLDDPKIAVCAVLYDGAAGNSAAPIVKAVYENYFKDELKNMNYIPSKSYSYDPPIDR